jgi:hypothetical protein
MKNDSNLDYAKSLISKLSPSKLSKYQQMALLIDAMMKYGDNHWWENKDERVLAYFQVNEPVLIIPWDVFERGLQNLLGRKVENREYAYEVSKLKMEAEIKYQQIFSQRK